MDSERTYLSRLAPGETAAAITPHDTNDIRVARVWVGGAGNVVCIPAGQTTSVTITGVPAGSYLPVVVKRVLSTSTTATNLVAIR